MRAQSRGACLYIARQNVWVQSAAGTREPCLDEAIHGSRIKEKEGTVNDEKKSCSPTGRPGTVADTGVYLFDGRDVG